MSVSQLTSRIEQAIKSGLPQSLLVKGETSNVSYHRSSGHLYFTLKDSAACIDCVMFRSDAARLKFTISDGMELLATGRVAVYAQRGRYQFYITALQPLGKGALELAFQQVRSKLEAEGLFSPQRKKPLPRFPARIVLITSQATAALQDMLKVLRPYPWVRLFVYHVPVQGDGSAEKITEAIEHVNSRAAATGMDLILLARGGGSLEDLWEFNEEVIARAVAASRIPIITGIGHEVDISIADLAADYHAHTPTEAAQVAMREWRLVKDAVDLSGVRLRRGLRSIVQEARQRLAMIQRHETFRRPLDRVNSLRQLIDDRQRSMQLATGNRLRNLQRRLHGIEQRLDQHRPAALVGRMRELLRERERRLTHVIGNRLLRLRETVGRLTAMLRERHPRHAVRLGHQQLMSLETGFGRLIKTDIQRRRRHLDSLSVHLQAIGPEQVLNRGYSITTRKKDGAVIRSASHLKAGQRLVTRFADGRIESIVEDSMQLPLFE